LKRFNILPRDAACQVKNSSQRTLAMSTRDVK
jgi:hypothetical protein